MVILFASSSASGAGEPSLAESSLATGYAASNPATTNAVDLYKKAARLYDELAPADKEEIRKEIGETLAYGKNAPILYAKVQPIMDLIRQGRRTDYSDWNFGPITTLENFSKQKGSASLIDLDWLTLWEAGYRFSRDAPGTVSDLAAMTVMATGGINDEVDFLQGLVIQLEALKLVAKNAARVTAVSDRDLAEITNRNSLRQNFQTSFDHHIPGFQLLARAIRSGQYDVMTGFKLLGDTEESMTTPDGLDRLGQWSQEARQFIDQDISGSESDFQNWRSKSPPKFASTPFLKNQIDCTKTMFATARLLAIRQAMLSAGLALAHGDHRQFQSIRDPSNNKPFAVSKTSDGFQLTSGMRHRDGGYASLGFSTHAD